MIRGYGAGSPVTPSGYPRPADRWAFGRRPARRRPRLHSIAHAASTRECGLKPPESVFDVHLDGALADAWLAGDRPVTITGE